MSRPKLNIVRVYKSDDGLTFEDKAGYLQHQQNLVIAPQLAAFFRPLITDIESSEGKNTLNAIVSMVLSNAEPMRQILGAPKRVTAPAPASQTGLVSKTVAIAPPAALLTSTISTLGAPHTTIGTVSNPNQPIAPLADVDGAVLLGDDDMGGLPAVAGPAVDLDD